MALFRTGPGVVALVAAPARAGIIDIIRRPMRWPHRVPQYALGAASDLAPTAVIAPAPIVAPTIALAAASAAAAARLAIPQARLLNRA